MGQLQTEPPPERIHGDVLYTLDPDELLVIDLDQGRDRPTELVVDSGSAFELFAGLIAIGASIIALSGYSYVMAALATVAVGFALLAQGATVAARWKRAAHIAGSERMEALGITTELFGGLVGIVLGVAAVFGAMPMTLLSVASMVIGGALLLGGPTQPVLAGDETGRSRARVTRDLVRSSSGVMVMAGLSALVLGLVAIIAGGPVLTLVSVAMMLLGAALVLAGGSLVAVLARRFG